MFRCAQVQRQVCNVVPRSAASLQCPVVPRFSVEADSLDVTAALLQSRAYNQLIDFDNHLDNISLDWRNLQLNQDIKEEIESF
jgi:Uncharacterised protein family (UPF0172)